MRTERRPLLLVVAGAAVGVVALIAADVVGGAAWRAWLGAAALLAGIPAGALLISAMLRLIPGSWREGLTRPLAALSGLVPLACLAMLPVLIAPGLVYDWAHRAPEATFRQVWLWPLFFTVRGLIWFSGLAVLAVLLTRDPKSPRTATAGILFLVAASLPTIDDWLLSLDEGFGSSGYGLYVLSIWAGLALALATAAAALGARERVRDVMGGVLFTGAALWAYLGFMQFFISWSEDLPGPAAWYTRRHGAWAVAAWLAIALKMAGFAPLIFGHVRRSAKALSACATLFASGAVPEIAWLVLPAAGAGGVAGAATVAIYLAAVAGLGLLEAGGLLLWRGKAAP